jgi:hypothetical protein
MVLRAATDRHEGVAEKLPAAVELHVEVLASEVSEQIFQSPRPSAKRHTLDTPADDVADKHLALRKAPQDRHAIAAEIVSEFSVARHFHMLECDAAGGVEQPVISDESKPPSDVAGPRQLKLVVQAIEGGEAVEGFRRQRRDPRGTTSPAPGRLNANEHVR